MSKLEEVLESLDDRARNGKTARALAVAAQDDLAVAELRVEKANAQVREASQINDQLRDTLRKAQSEVDRLNQPRIEQEISGSVVTFKYAPTVITTSLNCTPAGLWRLAELESAITHLRMAGGADNTQVRVGEGVIVSKLANEDSLPSGWSFTIPESEKIVVKAGLPIKTWIALTLTFIAGVGMSNLAYGLGTV